MVMVLVINMPCMVCRVVVDAMRAMIKESCKNGRVELAI